MTLPYTITLVARREATTLSPAAIEAARALLASQGIQTGRPDILSPGEAADVPCTWPAGLRAGAPAAAPSFSAVGRPPPAATDATLETIRAGLPQQVDVLLTRTRGRRKGLLVADMDSTIVEGETLDELAALLGVGDRVAAITRRSMNGELDFAQALRERVGLLQGRNADALETAWAATRLTGGARTLVATMRAHNAHAALVSGGFTWFTGKVAALCGFDAHHANTLGVKDGKLTGRVAEPILGREAKLETLRELAASRGLKPQATLAVGDGANDLDMLGWAGLGVAFHAKPVVAAAVTNRVDHADLRALLFAQGYPASAFRD